MYISGLTGPDDYGIYGMPATPDMTDEEVESYEPTPFLDSARVAAEALAWATAPWEPSGGSPAALSVERPRRSLVARFRSFFTGEAR